MFTDRVKVKMIAGKGGNGVVAWRRERFIPKGGPYGGNGGRGGDIILEADSGVYSLEPFRNRRILKAKNGQDGGSNLKQGRSGAPLHLKVPYGTLVKDGESGEVLFDFTPNQTKWTLCEGGKGGKGNAVFKTSTRQAPNICTPGKAGEEKEVELELKLIADVGLIGMPNAGKSTLMSRITHAEVKVGAYPFTTLSPNLSYIQCEDYTRILVADIPGIIENAHKNKGLGFAFLRHIERTSALVFVIDIANDDELRDFAVLQSELGAYKKEMLEKPFIVALNKTDIEGAEEKVAAFKRQHQDIEAFPISAANKKGLDALIRAMERLTRSSVVEREYASTH